jgi:hypothetical protein
MKLKTLICTFVLLLGTLLPAAAQTIINGANTPDQITDSVAYRQVFLVDSLPANPTQTDLDNQARHIATIGMSQDDSAAYKNVLANFRSDSQSIIQSPGQLAGEPTMSYEQSRDALTVQYRGYIAQAVTVAGQTLLDNYVQTQKRLITVTTSGGDPQAGTFRAGYTYFYYGDISDDFGGEVDGGVDYTDYCLGDYCIPWSCSVTPTSMTLTLNNFAVTGPNKNYINNELNSHYRNVMTYGTVYPATMKTTLLFQGGGPCLTGTSILTFLGVSTELAQVRLERGDNGSNCSDQYNSCWYLAITWCSGLPAGAIPDDNPIDVFSTQTPKYWGWDRGDQLVRFSAGGQWYFMDNHYVDNWTTAQAKWNLCTYNP